MAPDIRNKEQMALFRQIRIDQGGVPEQVDAYLDSLIKHITYVREAGQRLGVDIGNLEFHDESKFSDLEFLPYVERYHGGNPDPDRYVRAWLHHIHHNPHHWQHWIFPDGFMPEGSSVERGVVKMPEIYALEMVADWMGSSMGLYRLVGYEQVVARKYGAHPFALGDGRVCARGVDQLRVLRAYRGLSSTVGA